jgi:GDYXXLXY protein
MTSTMSSAKRAGLAGAICLLILTGMIVGHAWPLWTGQIVTMTVVPLDPRDLFRGEYVHLDTAANQLCREGSAQRGSSMSVVRPLDRVFDESRPGSFVYVQLAASPSGDYVPVTASLKPQPGAVNLRGRSRHRAGPYLAVDYGLDAFYLQEGKGRRVEEAIRQRRNVQIQVAIATSGQARIKTLLVDGVSVDRF